MNCEKEIPALMIVIWIYFNGIEYLFSFCPTLGKLFFFLQSNLYSECQSCQVIFVEIWCIEVTFYVKYFAFLSEKSFSRFVGMLFVSFKKCFSTSWGIRDNWAEQLKTFVFLGFNFLKKKLFYFMLKWKCIEKEN